VIGETTAEEETPVAETTAEDAVAE
jgi:hypothetical protein